MKSIAILGTGPAGMLAAHAAFLTGRPCSLHSIPKKSKLGGAQFLHRAIPMLTAPDPDFHVTNRLQGTAEGYREKVYGTDDPTTQVDFVSAESVKDGETIGVWDLGKVYDAMWEFNSHAINEAQINARWLEEHYNEFSLIISSLPAPAICRSPMEHRFTYQEVWIDPSPPEHVPENTIVYNGDKSPSWYRASRIGSAGGVEWSARNGKPPVGGLVSVKKPIRTNCDCWPDILRVGRYGEWRKGVLVHHAYEKVCRYFLGENV